MKQKESSKEKEYLAGWKRARADLENLQKRMGDQLTSQKELVTRDVIESLLPLADNFKALVDHAPSGEQGPWVAGVVHVARQLEQTLGDLGVQVIHDTGGDFDPSIHEAITEVEEPGKEGKVVAVVQVGYKIGNTTIRPAKVTIGKATAEQSSRAENRDPGEGE